MNIGNDPKKRLNMSIKPMLNIRPGSPDGRYTLVIQLILERRRGVLFTPYRLLPEEFDLRKRKAVTVNQRKTHVAHIRDVNAFLEKQRAVFLYAEKLFGIQKRSLCEAGCRSRVATLPCNLRNDETTKKNRTPDDCESKSSPI